MNLPKEPNMLLSFINMKLRDSYSSLEAMCEDLDLDTVEIKNMLEQAGIRYDEGANQLKMK